MVGAGMGEPVRAIGMISWQGLIASSRLLITAPDANTPPLPDSIRRSVSTAYYAMFHALAASNAECLIGTPQGTLGEHAWLRAYRGLDHREARRNLKQGRHLFSSPVQRFIDTFGELQDARHAADYDPSRVITLSEAVNWIDRAETAIREIVGVDWSERSAMAVQALIRRRSP